MLMTRVAGALLSEAAPPTSGTERSTFRSISVNRVLTMKKMIRLKTMSIIGVKLIAGRSSWCVFRGMGGLRIADSCDSGRFGAFGAGFGQSVGGNQLDDLLT